MKKIILLTVLTISCTALFAQGGRIRVYFSGFECYRETWDDILQTDGKGDEVFFNFSFLLADKNGSSKLNYEKRTAVYGDATGPFSNRISAGTCVDLFGNLKGGLKAGDTYRCNDLIGEYDMADRDILTIVPTGWEHDPVADNSIAFTSTIKSFYNSINQKVAPIMIGLNVLTGNLGGIIYNSATLGLSSIKAGGNQGELGNPGTRPIGMEKYGDFSAKLVVLNTPNLTTICNSDMGFGKGVIAVNYDEVAVGNLRDHGNYTILLRMEYMPKQTVATNPPPPPPSGSYTNPPPPPPPSGSYNNVPPPPPPAGSTNTSKNPTGNTRKMERPASGNTITGNWVGTYGTGETNNPNYYCFRLNEGGTMQVVAANGNVIANGNYTYSNNQLMGTYTYTNAGAYSFSAVIDANGALNGTWGSGSNVRGGGRWIMNKK